MKRHQIIAAAAVCLIVLAGIRFLSSPGDTQPKTGSGVPAISQPQPDNMQEPEASEDAAEAVPQGSTQFAQTDSKQSQSSSSASKIDPHEWEDPERPINQNSNSNSSSSGEKTDNSATSPDDSNQSDDEQTVPVPEKPAASGDLSVTQDDQGGFGKLQ